jgi:hypothetical protein
MPDLGIDKLGPFPLLQLAAAMVILAGLAVAVYRGTRDRKLSADQYSMPGSARWYFDGPLNAALETLRDTYRVMCNIDHQVATFGELFRTHIRLLDEIKAEIHDIRNTKDRRR